MAASSTEASPHDRETADTAPPRFTALPDEVTVKFVKRADLIDAVTEAVYLAGWPEDVARRRVGKGYEGTRWTGKLAPLDQVAA